MGASRASDEVFVRILFLGRCFGDVILPSRMAACKFATSSMKLASPDSIPLAIMSAISLRERCSMPGHCLCGKITFAKLEELDDPGLASAASSIS